MPDFLVLDYHSRQILRMFLSGRERLHNIDPVRWAEFKAASTAEISHNELAEILDCFGREIMDLLLLPLEKKKKLLALNEEKKRCLA